MIPVTPVSEPVDFDLKARRPGNQWLADHPGFSGRPPSHWTGFTKELSDGFRNLCGYAAMLDPTGGTVDHYLSWQNHPHLAYEWSNYRFASGVLNSSKKTADAAVLDPYEVGEGWFEILLPSLQMRVTGAVPAALRDKAEYTLTRLKLRDGERVIRWRQSWFELYLRGELALEGLRTVAPLIAAAVDRQQVQQDQVAR